MRNKDLKELKTKTREQLEKEALELEAEIARLKGQMAVGRLKNVRQAKVARVNLARVKLILRQASIAEESTTSAGSIKGMEGKEQLKDNLF